MKPEEIARVWIDEKLNEAGWVVVDRDGYAPGMTAAAIREVGMRSGLEADYVLLVNGKAAAVIEAKRAEIPLDDPHLIAQAENYLRKLQPWYPAWERPLRLVYLSNGREIAFKDCHEPDARYELIEKFPRPKDLVKLLKLEDEFAGLPHLFRGTLRECQFKAINALEASFKAGKRRAVMVLATGSGKTFTACMIAYRMLTYTPTKRVLFLVDRNNLGVAALSEFQGFKLTESGKPFSEIYGVERLASRPTDGRARVVVSTIQRLYSQLTGAADEYSEEEEDEASNCVTGTVTLPEKLKLPPDYFDLIIVDECHRSIYSDWQKVLTYFSGARIIGMTATPIPETLAFFDGNVVANYTLEQSIVDGVNVGARIYRIKTELGENGGEIEKGATLEVTNRGDRSTHEQKVLEKRPFEKTQLNRSIMVRDQIRKVLQEYKDAVYTKMYPDREPDFDYLPKTLIFAVSEIHAQMVVEVAKEVFGRTDDRFVQRITYSVGDSNERIREFRNDVDFRIAVTVTLVATGTDVKPLEVLIFLNDVHSETLYVQMKGRGVRTISPSALRAVTPNATSKDLYFLIDAVGVTESEKVVPGMDDGADRPLNPTLSELFEKMALGVLPDDYFELLAGKLSCIGNRADPEDLQDFAKLFPETPCAIATRIFEALQAGKLPPYHAAGDENAARRALIADLLDNIPARKKLIEIAHGYVKEIVGKEDSVISSGFSAEDAQKSTAAFEAFVNAHRDDIEALRLIYNQQAGELTREKIDELSKALASDIPGFGAGRLWDDYALLKPGQVKPLGTDREAVTNLIQLVRFAYGQIESLYSLASVAAQRFELWCGQKQRDFPLDAAQKELFRKIAAYIAQNGGCDFKSIRRVMPEIATGLIRALGSLKAANVPLYSLSEFILKVA